MNTRIQNERSGVALIIVLGWLAIMVILAISFSISTRTERAAARAYIDMVKARQLVHTSLNRVIGDHIGNSMLRRVYPAWSLDVLTSGSDADTNNVLFHLGSSNDVFASGMMIPMSLRPDAYANDGARWIGLQNQEGTWIGEYSFVAVNCSGLLDAMAVGSRTRANGSDAGEIQVSSNILPEIVFADTDLDSVRSTFGRFETVNELYFLLSSPSSTMNYRGPSLFRRFPTNMVDNFHVFSRFPSGYAEDDLGAATNQAFVGGDPSGWNTTEIQSALQLLDNAPIPDIPAFVRAMIDYADNDILPAGGTDAEKFQRISSEPAAMFNEVVVSNTFELVRGIAPAPDTLIHRVYLVTELWYPFPAIRIIRSTR